MWALIHCSLRRSLEGAKRANTSVRQYSLAQTRRALDCAWTLQRFRSHAYGFLHRVLSKTVHYKRAEHREQADIERWDRRMELDFAAIGRTIQNTVRSFKQFPDYGEAQRTVVHQRLERWIAS